MAGENNPIRFGIIGCAAIARKLSRAISLAPNATVTAVGSRSEDKARRFVADNGLPETTRVYGSYEGVLDDPCVDAVYLPLPTSLHLQWAVAAAERGKHVLLEKPTALCAADLEVILAACESKGVQFMDSTMWMHHPRTAKMEEFIKDPSMFGQLRLVNSVFSFNANPNFLENDIRVKPDLDALGALGDAGWYCIRSVLWAADYVLPKTAFAHRGPVTNESGVILSCGSTLLWEDGRVATFQCSFLAPLTLEIYAIGTRGTLNLGDFVVPSEELSARFSFVVNTDPEAVVEQVITTDLPQEALMVKEFARLAGNIRDSSSQPDKTWPTITRKTQLVLDAVKASIDRGFKPVDIVG